MTLMTLNNNIFADTTQTSSIIDNMLDEYSAKIKRIDEVTNWYNSTTDVIHYFFDGNRGDDRYSQIASNIFNRDGAIAALNAEYWQRAMNLTDVLDVMPAARRTEWYNQIRGMKTPDFITDIVKPTILDLLQNRERFFAERVDGIFQALSGNHVTNQPQAFGKRMIFERLVNEWGSLDYRKTEHINDLRAVIARFMGRDSKDGMETSRVVNYCKNRAGEWVSIDGCAIKLKLYKKGSAHIEIHPDIAWRLNSVLASLYPNAIAAPSRKPPTKAIKEFNPIEQTLPFDVIVALSKSRKLTQHAENAITLPYDLSKHVKKQVEQILGMLGGIIIDNRYIQFDYDPMPILDELIVAGRIPDYKSHQYYPTPEKIAQTAIDLAEIQDSDKCLEPSGGTGNIAKFLPKNQTTCVELSKLFCKSLEDFASIVINADFLKLTKDDIGTFDKIVMNPPFSEGRAKLHTVHAALLLNCGGNLVAVLPSSMKNNFELDDCVIEWCETFTGDFEMTGVSVVLMKAKKTC